MVLDFSQQTFKKSEDVSRQIEQVYGEDELMNGGTHFQPAIVLKETDNSLIVNITLPDIEHNDLDIQVTGEAAIVSGTIKDSPVPFRQLIALTKPVDRHQVTVNYTNGILTLNLTKVV